MGKRTARVICGAMAWIVLAAAAVFVFRSERDVESLRSAQRLFDQRAREATDAIGELRAAQQAYVVGGQGVAFWVAKVVTTGDTVRASIETLRNSSIALMTRAALDNALKSLDQFTSADKRALEYINASQPLMAGDVIFTEGGQAAAGTSQHVEAARLAERQEVDVREAGLRRQETMTLVACAALLAAIVVLLVPASADSKPLDEPRPLPMPLAEARTQPYTWSESSDAVEYAHRIQVPANGNGHMPANGNGHEVPAPVAAATGEDVTIDGWRLNLGDFDDDGFDIPVPQRRNDPSDPIRLTLDAIPEPRSVIMPAAPGFLKAAADLATDFGRIHDFSDLKHLIARAALLTEASGVVVWLGNSQGGDLRPVLTHGYSAQVVSHLTPVSRSANNAAAAAYRSGTLQVVPSQPFSSGAIVAPILGPEGCIGALSAEFRGAESSEPVQAFAAIVAAHLAGVLASSPGSVTASRAAS